MVSLADVHQNVTPHKRRRRVGRGTGSGRGKTASRGHKGDGSRSGCKSRRGDEGGQMPLFRRVAKRGFSNAAFAPEVRVLNLDQIEGRCQDGDRISIEMLRDMFTLPRSVEVKILARGVLTRSVTIEANAFSAAAEAAIVQAGGTAVRV